MTLYAFILGRKNLLSTAELCSVLENHDHIVDIQRESVIAALQDELPRPQESLNRLGGSIKIARVFHEFPLSQANIASTVSEHLIQKFEDRDTKVSYGLSVYNFPQRHDSFIRKTLMAVKKDLKAADIKSRFINKNFQNPKNAAIAGEKLIEGGAEILVIQGKHKLFLAETVALQDFEAYSHRDYDRPVRDPKLGMLPPKLSQIMINLGGYTKLHAPLPHDTTLYDPFAGIGTVLIEGLLLGYNVVGSDISEDVLRGATQNLEWAKQQFAIINSCDTFQKDATALTRQDLSPEINLIVTESYLGPPVKQLPDHQQIKKNFHHIEETLTRFFRAIHDIIQPGTPVVISFAAYRAKHQTITMEQLPQKITTLGYKIAPLIPKDITTKFSLQAEESLLYDRPDQIVGRQIWKFIRT